MMDKETLAYIQRNYETEEEAALALLSHGSYLLEKVLFQEGQRVKHISITPLEDREDEYEIEVWTNYDFYDFEDDMREMIDDEEDGPWDDLVS